MTAGVGSFSVGIVGLISGTGSGSVGFIGTYSGVGVCVCASTGGVMDTSARGVGELVHP